MLKDLGLDAVSEQVFRALLDEPALEEDALIRSLGLTRPQVAAAVERLTDLALLRKSRQDPSRRYPVTLDRAAALLVAHQEEELEARRKALLAGKAVAAEVVESAAHRRSQLPAGVQRITAKDDIQNQMESLTHAAVAEVCSIVPQVMPMEALEASRRADEELLRRGLKVRVVCHENIRSNAAALAYERDMLALGAQVRISAVLPMRLLIVDQKGAILPFDPEAMEEGAILTTAPGMVQSLRELFERVWADAHPLDAARSPDEATGLTGPETELLKILAGGLTDEAAAKRLGISVRTVKRRMEVLMRRLDAGSRFEAGYRAAKRGWV